MANEVTTTQQQVAQIVNVSTITQNPAVAKRFSDILGKKSAGFVSSLVSLSKTKALAVAEPNSVVASALVAASLDLPIVPTLGFAAIVPFRDKKSGRTLGQFQIMQKGLVQLAQRSGQYETINVATVYEGDIKTYNRFTGEIEFNTENTPDMTKEPIGYVAYMKLTNGFKKYLYMTIDEIKHHGQRYSQTFRKGYGLWVDQFDAMAKKTCIKLLLSKYGPLSVETFNTQMQLALKADQAAIRLDNIADTDIADAAMEYVDNVEEVEVDEETAKKVAKKFDGFDEAMSDKKD